MPDHLSPPVHFHRVYNAPSTAGYRMAISVGFQMRTVDSRPESVRVSPDLLPF